jgi:hemoglobin
MAKSSAASASFYLPIKAAKNGNRLRSHQPTAMEPEPIRRDTVAIDEDMIRALVHGFYARVRRNETIGPIFNHAIGDGWDTHLAKLCDFWSSVMLQTGRYQGRPMAAHLRLSSVRPEHFERWLDLFRLTAREVCPADIAEQFVARAETIARSFQLGMFYSPVRA